MQEMQTPRRGKEHLAQLGSQGVSSWSGEERRRASELVKRVLRLRAGGEQQRHSHHENRSNLASRTEGHSGAMVTRHLLWRGTAGKAPWVAGNETVTQCHRRNPGNTGEGGCKKPQRGRQWSAKETYALLEQPRVQEQRGEAAGALAELGWPRSPG